MIVLYPVSDSVRHVHPLPGIDLLNIEQELVCVPVRIQFQFLHPKPVSRHHLIPFFFRLNSRPTALTYSGNCEAHQRIIVPFTFYTWLTAVTDTPILFSCLSTIAFRFAMRIVLLKEDPSTF